MRIDGGTGAKRRQDLVASFQDTSAASPRVALLSINAAGQVRGVRVRVRVRVRVS